MAAVNFPNPAATNPETGEPYSAGWTADNGVTYIYEDNSWKAQSLAGPAADDKYVNVDGDNMTGNLSLGTDKITLDASNGSAEFAGAFKQEDTANGTGLEMKTSVNNWSIHATQDSGTAAKGLYLRGTSGDGTRADGLYVYPGATGSTAPVWFPLQAIVGGTVISPNITLDGLDGSASFAGDVKASAASVQLIDRKINFARSSDNAFAASIGFMPDVFAAIQDNLAYGIYHQAGGGSDIYIGLTTDNGTSEANGLCFYNVHTDEVTAKIRADGSAEFAGALEVGNYNSGNSTSGGILAKPSGQLVVQSEAGSKESPKTAIQGYETSSTGTMSSSWYIKSDGSAVFKGTVQTAGGVVTPSAIIQTETDNPDNYTSTTIEGEEQLVYNGPTLDVKERLTKTQTALTALKAAALDTATDLAGLKAAIVTALADI